MILYNLYLGIFSFINDSTNFFTEILKIEECTDDILIEEGTTEILFGNSIIQK